MATMEEKFAGFDRLDLPYNSIDGRDISTTVLLPSHLNHGGRTKCPVMVHWHGGAFVLGHRMYAPWWPNWSLELALSEGAIIISPDYRLVPEANGTDILADVEAFWNWVRGPLLSIADADSWSAYPDTQNIITFGHSAGGYLAVQSWFLTMAKIKLKAVITISATLDRVALLRRQIPGTREASGAARLPPKQAEAVIRDYIAGIMPNAVRTSGDPVEMWSFFTCIDQQGWMPRLLGFKRNPLLDLTKALDTVDSMPPLWIMHGYKDTLIPYDCSTEFAKAVKAKFADLPLRLNLESEDHTSIVTLTTKEPWIQEGCAFIRNYWRGQNA